MKLSPDQVTAVILAGGFGTRLQHLLPNLPKPMAPVAGKPFIEWVVRYLARQGVRRLVISTGYLAEMVARHFRPQPVKGVKVSCVAEAKPLGTAGGFLNAVRVSKGEPVAWLVLNGDSLALAPLRDMFRTLSGSGVEGVVLGVPMADASRYGTITLDAEGGLRSFNEKKPGAGIINAGVYLFRASAIEVFPARAPLSFEVDVFPALTARQAGLKVCVTQAPFLDIGTPDSLALADSFIRQHIDEFATD
ncbi:MAG: nucleotidyltransferase family protein [Verrucomicrobia bacterium]|nr:nucleotidyltransferase family protein [Verrucomicrobiota bacterium]